jgi:hypothetical protein
LITKNCFRNISIVNQHFHGIRAFMFHEGA